VAAVSAVAETPTALPAPVAHADAVEGEQLVATTLRPMVSWTMEATVSGDLGVDGVVMAVSEPGTCVRALIVRKGRIGLLGWSWRGGHALWCERLPEKRSDASTHLAAVLSDSGNLVLFVDGQPLRSWSTGGLFAGRHTDQELVAAPAVTFGPECIPGWATPVRSVTHYDHALSTEVIAGQARAALGLPEPVPPPPPAPRPPDPVGCPNPAHVPAWRRDGKRLRCLQCEPPRGCPHDEHEPYWRRASGDMLSDPDGWWNLTCSLCETTAARLATNHEPGAPS
jgi:hypothetical protein